MKVLIAPNSLKNAANAAEIADSIEAGILKARPGSGIRKMPLADGGEFTLDVLLNALGGERILVDTLDPIGRHMEAEYGITDEGAAIIELPRASGYELLTREERNPLFTSTYGTGIQVRDAIRKGCHDIYLTLGGSATVDGGAGILQALGIELLDKHGEVLPRGGGNLIILDSFRTDNLMPETKGVNFKILCDVVNPLLGASGAAMIFAPQKGAGPLETMLLERCLSNFSNRCETWSGKTLNGMKGAGAAGGVAVGLTTFFKTKMISGTDYVLSVLNADKYIGWADVVITAEGSLDNQTFEGKAPAVLAKRAKKAGKRVICIAGSVPHRVEEPDPYFDAVFSMQNQPMSLDESIRATLENIKNTAFEIGRLL